MQILIVGAFGTIGKYVTHELKRDAEIIAASFSQGDVRVDLNSIDSINTMYESLSGDLDAVICVASRGVVLKHLTEMQVTDYQDSLRQKFYGQIQLVLAGIKKMRAGGSFTLTTGIMNKDFIKHGSLYLPLLKNAKYVGSFFVTRVVKMHKEKTDERLNEITKANKKIISIFSGKWNTCIGISKNLENMIK